MAGKGRKKQTKAAADKKKKQEEKKEEKKQEKKEEKKEEEEKEKTEEVVEDKKEDAKKSAKEEKKSKDTSKEDESKKEEEEESKKEEEAKEDDVKKDEDEKDDTKAEEEPKEEAKEDAKDDAKEEAKQDDKKAKADDNDDDKKAKKDADTEPKDEEMKDADDDADDAKAATTTTAQKRAASTDDDDDPAAGGTSNKRSRKSAQSFTPDNFRDPGKILPLVHGRGTKLKDIPAVKANINKYAQGSSEMLMAHKLLYTTRGKPTKKLIKGNILEFYGYLPFQTKGQDKKTSEDLDEKAESKMGDKAYKLTVPQLKKMCDFFAINRQGCTDKDSLVDVLLDFLGAPSEELVKGASSSSSKKKAATTTKKKAKKKASAKDDEETEEEEEEEVEEDKDYEAIERGTPPTEKQLRQWVVAYVRCFNMEKVNLKHALEVAGDKFGVDLTSQKKTLKKLLTEEM